MKHSDEQIVFFRDLDAGRAEELRQLVHGDPEAARLLRHWMAVHREIGRGLHAALSDHETFALYVLRERGRGDLLTDEERARVDRAERRLARVLGEHSGLAAVADDLAADADAFDAEWDRWFEPPAASPRRMDRSQRRRGQRRVERSRSRAGKWVVRGGIAATAAAFILLVLLVGRRDFGGTVVATGPDEVRVVEIGDGSTVRMLGNSRLAFVPPDRATVVDRQAEFEGAGFFDIAPDERGFVLKTPNAQAVVLGTSFGVRSSNEQTEVVLAEGRLTLSSRHAPGRSVLLGSGQLSRVESSDGPTPPVDVHVHDRLAWTGLFVFQAVPMHAILDVLSEAYSLDLTADDPLVDEQVTGRFERTQPAREILDVIAAAVNARLEERGSGYHLSLE